MKRLMRHLLLGALLGGWALAQAQAPPGQATPNASDPGSDALPCVPADAVGETEADAETDGAVAAPCEEPEEAAAEDAGGGPQAAVEEDMAIEASADEVFRPDDEISEDYPIPLPSDI